MSRRNWPSLAWIGLVFMAALLRANPLRADVVYLKKGDTIEGFVTDGTKKGTVEVRTGEGGSVVLSLDDIIRIERKQAPADELDARLKQVLDGDLDALEDLILWARDHQLRSRARAVAKKALEIDSNSELARKELGYVLFENRWILESELKKRKGLVRFQGEWMTDEERARRAAADVIKEMDELLSLISNENSHIQEYALGKLLNQKDPAAREVFAGHLKDEREAVRWVAVRGLANFPTLGGGDVAAKSIAGELHRLTLTEKNEKSLPVFYYTLGKFFPLESRRLAEATAKSSAEASERKRALEILERLDKALR